MKMGALAPFFFGSIAALWWVDMHKISTNYMKTNDNFLSIVVRYIAPEIDTDRDPETEK